MTLFHHTDLIKRLIEDNWLDLAMLLENFLKTVKHLNFCLAGYFQSENATQLFFVLALYFIHVKPEFFSL